MNSRCQWPIGTPGTESFCFCDQTAELKRPYCAEHVRIAFIPLSSPRDQSRWLRSTERLADRKPRREG